MKYFLTLLILFSFNLNAQIYDSFMCYTEREMVVIHGILTPVPTVTFHYQPLEQNPIRFRAKIHGFDRSTGLISVSVKDNNGLMMDLKAQSQMGHVDLDLRPYCSNDRGLFEYEKVICFFGYYED